MLGLGHSARRSGDRHCGELTGLRGSSQETELRLRPEELVLREMVGRKTQTKPSGSKAGGTTRTKTRAREWTFKTVQEIPEGTSPSARGRVARGGKDREGPAHAGPTGM